MAGRGRKKRDIPVTGILAGVVVVLLVCLGILVSMTMRQGRTEKEGQSAQKNVPETGRLVAASDDEEQTERMTLQTERMTSQAEGKQTDAAGEIDGQSAAETEESESDVSDGQKDSPKAGAGTKRESGTEPEGENAQQNSKKSGAAGAQEDASEVAETEETEETEETVERLVVAIDPGHQGSWVNMSDKEPNGPGSSEMKAKATTGTQGRYSGKAEYELNLEISLLLREELERRGYEVILTREDHDAAISNSERALMAYEEGGDIYVRIHANGSDDTSVQGALAMVPSASNPYVGALAEDSYLLAECILDGYCKSASFASLGIQYYDNMTGINWSKLPVMILEMGFMTNESDDLRMADETVQPLMAAGIADGIDAYFIKKGLKEKEVPEEAARQMRTLIQELEEKYVEEAAAQGERWAVSVEDLSTGAVGEINGDVQMASASVIKVFLMAAIYDRVCYPASEERHISFDEMYDGELKQLITDMITVSDNTAANTLLARLGHGDPKAGIAVVNQFCEENGYTQTAMGRQFLESDPQADNWTSANDCRRLLKSIYEGNCVCAEASAKMYAYLTQQTRTGKIPAGLSGTTAVAANKTGELAGDYGQYVENDIAVVEDGDSAYVVCILSGDLKDNGAAVERIGQMSGAIYRGLSVS